MAAQGAPEGTTVVAECQTQGRGRLDRVWVSEPGNVYLSQILRPSIPAKDAPQLTYVAALAVKEMVSTYVKDGLILKWPNDVMVHHKKIAGILNEVETKADGVDFVILGIGINVNQKEFPPEISQTATSLFLHLSQTTEIDPLIETLLKQLKKWYDAYLHQGFSFIQREWEKQSRIKGRHVVLQDGSTRIEGTAQGLNAQGALVIRDAEGKSRAIFAGDLLCY